MKQAARLNRQMLRPAATRSRARDRFFQQQNAAFEGCTRSGSGERGRDGACRSAGDIAAATRAPSVVDRRAGRAGCAAQQRHREGQVAQRQRSNVDTIHVRQHLRHVLHTEHRIPRRQLVFVVEEVPQGRRTDYLADGAEIHAVASAKLAVDGQFPFASPE